MLFVSMCDFLSVYILPNYAKTIDHRDLKPNRGYKRTSCKGFKSNFIRLGSKGAIIEIYVRIGTTIN